MHRIGLTLLLALTPAIALAGGDADAGQKKSQPCAACHGPDGNKTLDPQYPKLAGQYSDYLAKSMRDYKTGARTDAVMAAFATTLTEQDIVDLAAFYAAQKGDLEDLSHFK